MPLSRRRFMRETALAAGGLALAGTACAEKDIPMSTDRPLFVSTWAFGKVANEQSLRIAEQGGSGPRRCRARHPRCRGRRL